MQTFQFSQVLVCQQRKTLRFNAVSDGVIVGSKIVRDLHDGKEEEVAEFVTLGSHFEK